MQGRLLAAIVGLVATASSRTQRPNVLPSIPLGNNFLPPDASLPPNDRTAAGPARLCNSGLVRMTLIMSVYVTEKRSGGVARHRYPRVDVLRATVASYASLTSIDAAYLFIGLDYPIKARWDELHDEFQTQFGSRLREAQPHQIRSQVCSC